MAAKKKPTARVVEPRADMPKRAALSACLPSEVVELADETQEGGSMYERTLRAGSRVMIAWHSGDHTFAYSREFSPGRWVGLVSLPAKARVSRVLVARMSAQSAPDADVEVDPLQRHAANEPLLRSK